MELFRQIEESFPTLEKLFDGDALKVFMTCEYGSLYNYHFSLGTWVRNNLLRGTSLMKAFRACGVTTEDDMSDLVIRLFYIYLHEEYPLS